MKRVALVVLVLAGCPSLEVTPNLAEGRLHAVGSDVHVFSRIGEVARVSLEPCAP